MTLADDLRLLGEIWHRTFGEVKCWSRCYICRDTDWPDAPWIKRSPTRYTREARNEHPA